MRRAVALALLTFAVAAQAAPTPPPQPPIAARHPHQTTLHGDRRVDDYAWLQDAQAPAVLRQLRAENAYTAAMMKPHEPLAQRLFGELRSHVQEDDQSPSEVRGGWRYYRRLTHGQQYATYLRQPLAGGPPEVVLDLPALARGKRYLDLGRWDLSDDGRRIAYLLDESGSGDYTLYVADLPSGRRLGAGIAHVADVIWAGDNRTLFYTVENAAKRSRWLRRHVVGERGPDARVYDERDDRFVLALGRTRSGAFVLATSFSQTTSEVRALPAATPAAAWRLIAPRVDGVEYYVDHAGERFYLRTNDRGRNFRLVDAPVAAPERAHWRELVPASPTAVIEQMDLFARYAVLSERADAVSRLRVLELATGKLTTIAMPEPLYEASVESNWIFDTNLVRFRYESLTTPDTWIDYDMRTGTRTEVKRLPVPGYDASRYVGERLWATSPDGTRVPVSLLRRKDVPAHSAAPLLLEAYGAYGDAWRVDFDGDRLPLLDRGVVFAWAHVRGGADLGQTWHDAGRMRHKQRSIDDFIAVAAMLERDGWTTPGKLAITTMSAGGILLGAVLNQRPELFHAALADVPFVDVLTTQLDASLPEAVSEREEWGDPGQADDYAAMRAYSPYDNVRAQAYPALLVRSALHDGHVLYWGPAKWVARLRATKTDDHPLLLRMNLEPAGHFGVTGRYDRLRERAFDDAFLLWQWGISE